MKLVVLGLLFAAAGCDQLFGLQSVDGDSLQRDAPEFFEYDGAVGLDTAGWPTNGMVAPAACSPASTADEDGDGRHDECDNCPLDPNDQMDVDQDGIGDVCDPHPIYAVERLAVFQGFNGTVGDAGRVVAGTWSVSGGKLLQTGTNNIRTLLVLAGGPWREPKLHLRFSNVRISSTATSSFVVGAYHLPAAPSGVTPDGTDCRVRYSSTGSLLEMARRRSNAITVSAVAMLPRVTPDVTLFVGAEQLDAPPHCDGARNLAPITGLDAHLLLPSDPTDPEPSGFGLFTSNARADFEAFAIYETTYP